jgi:hypothetical protein
MIYMQIVPPKTTVTGAFYCSVLKTLMDHSKRKLLDLVGHWVLLHDNARPHVVNTVINFLTSKGTECIPVSLQARCSTLNFFVSYTRKTALRTVLPHHRRWSKAAKVILKMMSKNDSNHVFDEQKICWDKCIQFRGANFETECLCNDSE